MTEFQGVYSNICPHFRRRNHSLNFRRRKHFLPETLTFDIFLRWRSIASWEFTANLTWKGVFYRLDFFPQWPKEFVDFEGNWILSTYFGMGKVDLCFEGLKTWWQRSHQESRVPTNFGRNFGICHLSTPVCIAGGFGKQDNLDIGNTGRGPILSGQAQLGPMKSCVPPVPFIAVSLGAHIEAAAGYGPVAVYAELLVSWPWDQVWKQITGRCSTHWWDLAI